MCKLLVLALFIVALTSTAFAQDPVKVDSNHYKVEFENAQVRVLRIKVGPHEKSIMHRHPNAVAIFLTDVNGKFTFPNGTSQDVMSKAGEARWTPAITHLPENLGDQPFEVVLVELKSRPATKRSARIRVKSGTHANTETARVKRQRLPNKG
jgi:quercetin dioxygenase-like cupin family protein